MLRLIAFLKKSFVKTKNSKRVVKKSYVLRHKSHEILHRNITPVDKKKRTLVHIPNYKWLNVLELYRSLLTKIRIDTKNIHDPKNTGLYKHIRQILIFFSISIFSMSAYIILKLGSPEQDEKGSPISDEFSNLPEWQQYAFRSMREIHYYKTLILENEHLKLLPDRLGFPYSQPKYTLVIELTDVLVHPEWTYATGWQVKIRPGLQFLLDNLHHHYEIVVYIGESGMTILPVVEEIDPKHVIAYKLVKEGSIFSGGLGIESLDDLNRDLSKVIVVDWNDQTVKNFSENLLNVKRWQGDDDETYLIDLAMFLKTVAENDIEDVRDVLRHYSKFDDPILVFRNNQKKYIDYLESLAAKERSQVEETKESKWIIRFIFGE